MNTMTIGKKLSAGFAVLGLMMAFIGGFSLFEFSTMNRAAIGFTDSILPAVVRTSTLGETINAVRRYELDVFLVADDPQQQAHYRNESEKSLREAGQQIAAHDATIWAEDVEERRTFDIVKAAGDKTLTINADRSIKLVQRSIDGSTTSGKLDTRGLPAPEYTGDDYRAPDSPVEEILAAIYAEILGLEPAAVSVDDSFFELGGDSLMAMRMTSALEKRLGFKIGLQEFISDPTVAGICQKIDTTCGDTYEEGTL